MTAVRVGFVGGDSWLDRAIEKKSWIEAALEDELEIPEPLQDDDFSGKFNLRLPKSLHRNLAMSAKAEGVSLNQLAMCLIASGLKVPMTR